MSHRQWFPHNLMDMGSSLVTILRALLKGPSIKLILSDLYGILVHTFCTPITGCGPNPSPTGIIINNDSQRLGCSTLRWICKDREGF